MTHVWLVKHAHFIICLKEEERRLRDEHIAYQQQQAKVRRERQEDLLMREAKARREVMGVMRERRKRLQQREVRWRSTLNIHKKTIILR